MQIHGSAGWVSWPAGHWHDASPCQQKRKASDIDAGYGAAAAEEAILSPPTVVDLCNSRPNGLQLFTDDDGAASAAAPAPLAVFDQARAGSEVLAMSAGEGAEESPPWHEQAASVVDAADHHRGVEQHLLMYCRSDVLLLCRCGVLPLLLCGDVLPLCCCSVLDSVLADCGAHRQSADLMQC